MEHVMHQVRQFTKPVFTIFISLVLSLAIIPAYPSSVQAAGCDQDFYSGNDVPFYDPCEQTCSTGTSIVRGNNSDYNGNPILTEAEMTAIEANQSFYESAAQKAGIPWQMIASLHKREFNLKREGPSNGYGPYQITPSVKKIGAYTDAEFQAATDEAALFLKNKAPNRDFSQEDTIKYAFFAYNGTAGVYKDQARALGFNDAQADNGEGSPYVMNRADAKRDTTAEPTKSNGTWGQIKQDYGSISYPANTDYGAFVIFAALGGSSNTGTGNSTDCGSTGLVTDGMNQEQADAFMSEYVNGEDSLNYLGGAGRGCIGGPLANCVSFSVYFINKYTNLKGFASGAPGMGYSVAGNAAARNPELETGTTPKPYAIFSHPSPSTTGHTGIVLAVNVEENTILIGEASCSRGLGFTGAHTYALDKYTGNGYTYTYTDGYLKTEMFQ